MYSLVRKLSCVLLLGVSLLTGRLVSRAEAIDFQKLESANRPTAMTATEDGKTLLIAHEAEDLISVIDLATGKLRQTISTKKPVMMLARGDKLFVGNKGAGTISVFSAKQGWERSDEVETGHPDVKFLAAPQGKYFDGWILVTYQEKSAVARLTMVDANKDKHFDIGSGKVGGGVATVDFEGKSYIMQHEVHGGGFVSEYRDFKAATQGKEGTSAPFSRDYSPYLFQTQRGPYWFGAPKIYAGAPPAPTGEELGWVVVPDRFATACYGITNDTLTCYGLDTAHTKIGTQPVKFPGDYERFAEKAGKPNQVQRYEYGYHDLYNVAVTLEGKLYLYLLSDKQRSVYFATATAFDTSAVVPPPVANLPAVGDGPTEGNKLPAKVAVGKPVTLKLQGAASTTWEIINGPAGATVNAGTLQWTPTKAQAGEQAFKIRAKTGGQTEFVRLQTTVVDISDIASTSPKPTPGQPTNPRGPRPEPGGKNTPNREPEIDLDAVGVFPLADGNVGLSYSADRTKLYVLTGTEVRIVDKSGLTVVQKFDTQARYRQLFERPDYVVALAAKSIDLLDKGTLKVKKSIDVDYSQLVSMAADPTKPITYVGVLKPSVNSYFKSKPVLEVNESTGAVRELPEVFGMWLAMAPQGGRLYTGLHQMYRDGLTWDAMGMRDKFSDVDVVATYDLSGATPNRLAFNEKPGANGRRFKISPDGKHVSYVAGGGAGGYGYSIAALAVDDVTRESSRYAIEAYPVDIAYHPTLNLVACTNGSKIWIFNRKTGEAEAQRFDSARKFTGIEHLCFAPGGARLMVAYKGKGQQYVLEAVPIKLDEAEQAVAEKIGGAVTAPAPAGQTPASGKSRVWSDKSGQFKIDAELVGVEGTKAVLKRANGELVRVEISAFCEADQVILRAR